MAKKDEKELDKTIELLENDDLAEQHEMTLFVGLPKGSAR